MPVPLLVLALSAAPMFFAPVGGSPVPLPAGRVACPSETDTSGWTVAAGGTAVRPPSAAGAQGLAVRQPIADGPARCGSSPEWVTLVAVGPSPLVDWSTALWDVDGGQLTLRGTHLKGSVLHWSLGDRSGDDSCPLPASIDGEEECSYALDRTLPAIPEQLQLRVLPPGARFTDGAQVFDASGRPSSWPEPGSPAQAIISRLLPPDEAADVATGQGRIALVHPEAAAGVSCEDATCTLDGNGIAVFDEHGSDEKLDLQIDLRAHLVLRNGAPPRSPHFSVPLQRCPIALASRSILRDLPDERVAIRVGGRCSNDPSLEFEGPNGPAPVVSDVRTNGSRYVLVDVGRVTSEELVLTVRREGTIVGRTSHVTVPAPTAHVRLELPTLGPVQFIPTNRAAQVVLPAAPEGLAWSVLPLPGLYDVANGPTGITLRGAAGAAGAVSLRLVLRDPTLPTPLNTIDLGGLTDPVILPIHVAHVPIPLAGEHDTSSFAQLDCVDANGQVGPLKIGVTSYVPFSSRGTCRLVLHSERIPVEDGAQIVRLTVDVSGSDGVPKPDVKVERRLVLRPGEAAQVLALSGVDAPFDRVRIRLSVETDEDSADGRSETISEAQWIVVFGTTRYRLYATVSFPTGLFRVSDQAHSGILSLNAGALLRGVLLSRDGQESVVGVEAGALWLAIPGDGTAAASAHGQAAIVAGLSIGVPIANASRTAQTSINLHAWVEYEVSRAVLHESGSPWGFIFGPSLTIGDVGRNF